MFGSINLNDAVCPPSLQLSNQNRMESPEVISQSSSLLPVSGFPMQVSEDSV